MKKIIIVNHSVQSCGVYQYGKRLADILVKSTNIHYTYHEINTLEEYNHICITSTKDAILYNYHVSTLPWLNENTMQRKVPNIGIHHENGVPTMFDHLINIDAEDTINSICRPLLTYIPNNNNAHNNIDNNIDNNIENNVDNNIPIIGSFGFGFNNKGFDKIIAFVNHQFDEAIIRLNITTAHFTDYNDQTLSMCNRIPRKEGIKLIITHDFMDDQQLLRWLNSNTINIFLYDTMYGRGCASTIDYALSVNKPIGISDSYMFRHIYSDAICVYKTPIRDIIQNGLSYLEQYKVKWSHDNLIKKMELFMFKKVFFLTQMKNNTVLDDSYRALLKPDIDELFRLVPAMMTRKFARANVQQAFAFKYIKDHFTPNDAMVCAGSYDDTCCAGLKALGYNIVEVDPMHNYDLHTYCTISNYKQVPLVFSVSVIEHVEKDEEFIDDICKLLSPGGTCVLTCDFNNNYKPGDGKPGCDYRFYTTYDLLVRFKEILDENDCYIDGEIDYSAPNDFVYDGFLYCFATMVFKKRQ